MDKPDSTNSTYRVSNRRPSRHHQRSIASAELIHRIDNRIMPLIQKIKDCLRIAEQDLSAHALSASTKHLPVNNQTALTDKPARSPRLKPKF